MAKELDKERYIVLKKGNAELVIDKIGAQLVSYKIDGVELMYQGALDPDNHEWQKTAPILFPNPGPMVSVAMFQKRDAEGNLMYDKKGKPIYDYQDLRSVVVGVDEEGNQKNFYVKQAKIDGKKQLVYVDKDGNALDGVEINTGAKGETLITVKGENRTYTIGKKPTVFVEYVHNGGYYYMTQHGFIQSTKFKKMGQTADSCVLGTRSGDDTTSEYPYEFNFAAVYSLGKQGQLETKFAAHNKGKQTMLGGIGWHPAFQLHDNPGKYKLVLKNVKGKPVYEDKEKGDFAVSEGEELDVNELIVGPQVSAKITGLESADVTLVYYPEEGAEPIEYLSMHVTSPNLILWARGNNMLAIEPWTTDSRQVGQAKNQHEIDALDGAPLIKPGETKELDATVAINSKYVKLVKKLQSQGAKRSR